MVSTRKPKIQAFYDSQVFIQYIQYIVRYISKELLFVKPNSCIIYFLFAHVIYVPARLYPDINFQGLNYVDSSDLLSRTACLELMHLG